MRTLILLFALSLLNGCASKPPVSLEGVDRALLPQQAVESIDIVRGNRVVWGGVIVATQNLADHTRIEVLGYPLDRSTRPQTDSDAQGRFVVHRSGYLEEVDFAPGRVVTVTGEITEVEQGTVGQAAYVYPVVQADELHLWKSGGSDGGGRFHFGFGVIISN